MYAVRCDNPDRPESCDRAFYYSMCRNPGEAIRKWNEYQESVSEISKEEALTSE